MDIDGRKTKPSTLRHSKDINIGLFTLDIPVPKTLSQNLHVL